jgi:hypothetical protein
MARHVEPLPGYRQVVFDQALRAGILPFGQDDDARLVLSECNRATRLQ